MKFIEYQKLSKKEKIKLNKKRRNTWGAISPVTKRIPNKKHYNRKKDKST